MSRIPGFFNHDPDEEEDDNDSDYHPTIEEENNNLDSEMQDEEEDHEEEENMAILNSMADGMEVLNGLGLGVSGNGLDTDADVVEDGEGEGLNENEREEMRRLIDDDGDDQEGGNENNGDRDGNGDRNGDGEEEEGDGPPRITLGYNPLTGQITLMSTSDTTSPSTPNSRSGSADPEGTSTPRGGGGLLSGRSELSTLQRLISSGIFARSLGGLSSGRGGSGPRRSTRLQSLNSGGRRGEDEDDEDDDMDMDEDEDDDEDDDDDFEEEWFGYGSNRSKPKRFFEPRIRGNEVGRGLALSGEFGNIPPHHLASRQPLHISSRPGHSSSLVDAIDRRRSLLPHARPSTRLAEFTGLHSQEALRRRRLDEKKKMKESTEEGEEEESCPTKGMTGAMPSRSRRGSERTTRTRTRNSGDRRRGSKSSTDGRNGDSDGQDWGEDNPIGWGLGLREGVGIPNSVGSEVAQYRSHVYSGQFSEDGSFYYTACQNFKVYIYDTSTLPARPSSKSTLDTTRVDPPSFRRPYSSWLGGGGRRSGRRDEYEDDHQSSMRTIKEIQASAANCRWTITDASLSRSNDLLAYSSITPVVHLCYTRDALYAGDQLISQQVEQIPLDFSNSDHTYFGIWSIRFSADGREIIAGANHYGGIYAYDIERRCTTLRVRGHEDDCNAVCWADSDSSHVLLSGSDDGFVKVWDRRSLGSQKAAGVLIGHTEGITYVASKGDGRYCLSNGKDQAARLWDLRKMTSSDEFSKIPDAKLDVGLHYWDYRQTTYRKPRYKEHPLEGSVMIYRGHCVLKTLIRAHFSPKHTTGQQYIYSGGADGRILIWNLDGTLASLIDRRDTQPLFSNPIGYPGNTFNDPSAPDPSNLTTSRGDPDLGETVRDVSWHPYEPTMMSVAWESRSGTEGSIARHDWKGWGKRAETIDGGARGSF